jgi:hypothetical protein
MRPGNSLTPLTKPSLSNTFAKLCLNFEYGITSSLLRAARALRMRVNMSEIGSVNIVGYLVSAYQEAFTTPVISPRLASSRKQIRHSEKSLMKPAFRPHFQQRLMTLEEYFGFTKLLLALAIKDFFAIFIIYFA